MLEKVKTLVCVSGLSLSLLFSGCGASNVVKSTGSNTTDASDINNIDSNSSVVAILSGVAGRIISYKMDKQKRELEVQVPEASIEAINGGQALRMTFGTSILFTSNSSALTATSRRLLTRFATNINANPETDINIVAQTDSTGSYDFNMKLSQERVQSVINFLRMTNISNDRMKFTGVEISQQKVDNNTPKNCTLNRRIEIYIVPSARMVQEAQKQAK